MRLLLGTLLLVANFAYSQATDQNAPSLTIYNQNFAVVRQVAPLQLKSGVTHIDFSDITAHVEPDSVILRPLDSSAGFRILEQNYRNDPISEQLLLSLYEGKTIDFLETDNQGTRRIISGKIVRSGYVPHYAAMQTYGAQYNAAQMAAVSTSGQPVVEVDGKLQFWLPGRPLFPKLADDSILRPTLSIDLESDKPGRSNAEFSYVSGGMSWHADYNVVAPFSGNQLDVIGWVTLDNQSGKDFPNACIKLMAGDVNKIRRAEMYDAVSAGAIGALRQEPAVSERSFDEYHLYTLPIPTLLRDRETKQVEFIRASGVNSQTIYVYDGVKIDPNYRNYPMESIRENQTYGVQSNPKVWVVQEIKNSAANHLGMPLPRGRVRFYRRDESGQPEFIGENEIDHTPQDEIIRLYTGNAFDLVGERRRTLFRIDHTANWIDEAFEIILRNHKKAPMKIRVVEHLYRWVNWQINKPSDPYQQKDSQTIEFLVEVPANGEKMLSYMVHYTW